MIKEEIWRSLEKLYTKFPQVKDTNSTDKEIFEAEKDLNLKFSDFYRYFVKYHAVNSIGDFAINTLAQKAVVTSTLEFNKDKNNEIYIISNNYNGKLVGVKNRTGEVFTIESNNQNKEQIADNFEDFLNILLTKIPSNLIS